MEITQVHIDTFSVLRQQTIPVLSPGITVFSGHNEAGKSTCLQFFKAMFFGYKRNNRFLEPITSQNASLTSGSITIRTQHTGTIICTRLPKGECEISLPDGSPAPISLQQLLGNITAEMYDNVFALSLQQLMTVKSLQGENVRHALYGAAFGSGLRSPGTALKTLSEQMNAILRQRSGGSINNLLTRLDAIATERASHAEDLPEYITTEHALGENKSAWQKNMLEREAAIRQFQNIRRRLAAWTYWEELQATQMALELLHQQIPKLKLDHKLNRHSLQQFNALLEKKETYTQNLASLKISLAKLEEKHTVLAQSAPYLKAQADIFILQEQKENMRQAAQLLSTLCQKCKNDQKRLQESYTVLGSQWNDDVLSSIDFSLASREKYRQRKLALAETSELLKEQLILRDSLRAEHAARIQEQTSLLQRYEKIKSELPLYPAETVRLFSKLPTLHHLASALPQQMSLVAQKALDLTRSLQGISSDWTIDHLKQVHISSQKQEELIALAQKATTAETACAEAAKEHQQAKFILEASNHELSACLERIATLGKPRSDHDLNQLAQAIKQAEQAQHTLQILQARAKSSQAEGNHLNAPQAQKKWKQNQWITIFFALGAIISALTSFFIALPVFFWSAVLCGSCSLSFWSFTLWIKKYQIRDHSHAQNVMAEEQRLLQASRDTQLTLITHYYPQLSTLSPQETILHAGKFLAQETQTNTIVTTQKTIKQVLQNKVKETETLLAQRKNLLAAAENERTAIQEQWFDWITANHFPSHMSPTTAELSFERIYAAQVLLHNVEESKQAVTSTVQTIQPLLQAFAQYPLYQAFLESNPDFPADTFSEEYCQHLLHCIVHLDKAAPAIQTLQEDLDLAHRLNLQLEDLTETLENLANRIESFQERISFLEKQHEAATAKWQSWLIEMHFDPSLTPETAEEALEHILVAQELRTTIQTSLQQEHDTAQRLGAYITTIKNLYGTLLCNASHEFSEPKKQQPLAAISDFSETTQSQQLTETLLLLDELSANLREAISNAAQQKQVKTQIENNTDSLEKTHRALQDTEKHLGSIFNQTHTLDAQEFYLLHSAWEKEEEYKHQELQQIAHLQRIAHEESNTQEALLEELKNTNYENLMASELQLATANAELEEQCTKLQQEKGRLEERKKTLEHTSAITDLLQEEATLTTELQEYAKEWQALALSKYLIETAKEQFEAASQHNVLGTASRFFSRLTHGEYTGISTQLDSELFFAVHSSGQKRDPEIELSQGTREQLYLSLRLAYIANHAQKAEPVPIILDDILVNFDPERARCAAEILAEFALTNQILFFTCHPHLGELLLSCAKDIVIAHDRPSHIPHSYVLRKGSIIPL